MSLRLKIGLVYMGMRRIEFRLSNLAYFKVVNNKKIQLFGTSEQLTLTANCI